MSDARLSDPKEREALLGDLLDSAEVVYVVDQDAAGLPYLRSSCPSRSARTWSSPPSCTRRCCGSRRSTWETRRLTPSGAATRSTRRGGSFGRVYAAANGRHLDAACGLYLGERRPADDLVRYLPGRAPRERVDPPPLHGTLFPFRSELWCSASRSTSPEGAGDGGSDGAPTKGACDPIPPIAQCAGRGGRAAQRQWMTKRWLEHAVEMSACSSCASGVAQWPIGSSHVAPLGSSVYPPP